MSNFTPSDGSKRSMATQGVGKDARIAPSDVEALTNTVLKDIVRKSDFESDNSYPDPRQRRSVAAHLVPASTVNSITGVSTDARVLAVAANTTNSNAQASVKPGNSPATVANLSEATKAVSMSFQDFGRSAPPPVVVNTGSSVNAAIIEVR